VYIEFEQNSEDFWIQVIECCVDEGIPVINVPLVVLARTTAMNLALKFNLTVFIKDNEYLFSTTKDATLRLLKEEDTLH
jgi:hypothetical protein